MRSTGVSVGQVTSITLDKQSYQALVIMNINDAVLFPIDSSAKILTAGLLGDQYVGIEPGFENKNLISGDLIMQIQSAVLLGNLIRQLVFSKAGHAGSVRMPSERASVAPGSAAALSANAPR